MKEHTLGCFLKIKGSNTPTDYQLSLFGLDRSKLKRNWFKSLQSTTIKEDCNWAHLLETIVPENVHLYTKQPVEKKIADQKMYVVKNFWGHYKVGISANVKQRMQELLVGNSEPIELLRVYSVFSSRACNIEKKVHNEFNCYHKRGEWFNENLPLEEVDEFMRNKGIVDYSEVKGWFIS